MLHRETDAQDLVDRIEALLVRLDDSALDKSLVEPLANEMLSLFEQLIQLRRMLNSLSHNCRAQAVGR